MELVFIILELIGTVAFSISGAVVGIRRNMDLFGVCILGLTTACGGGLVRDVLLGRLPPVMFCDSIYALTALATAALVFLFFARHWQLSGPVTEKLLRLSDSLGLGIFTMAGMQAAVRAGYGDNFFFTVFLGTVTGVGGGLLRDVMAQSPPYIFVKHIYACASLLGAVLAYVLWRTVGENWAILAGCVSILTIRLLAARYRWSLPRIRPPQEEPAGSGQAH